MKNSARFVSLLLVVCVILSSVAFAAKYSDVTEDKAYYNPISLLSSLDIIKGYEDGTFGPEKDVTRAEFTVMLMRTMGLSNVGSSDLAGMPFTDLSPVKDWAASDIRTAYDLGIINGMDATTFAPNEKVTYEQSIKMVVCALGYEPMALDKVGNNKDLIWPNGYLLAATQINLTSGIQIVTNQPAKRWEIARILYNALDIDVMEKVESAGAIRYQIKTDKTFLSDRLRVKVGTGEIVADEKTSVDADGKIARSGEALVYEDETASVEVYAKGTVSTDGMIGRMVKYYYREDNNFNKTLVYLEDKTKSSSILTVDIDDIDNVTGSLSNGFNISYYENKDDATTKKISTSQTPIITINGRLAKTSDITTDTFMPESGSIEFMDSDNNGSFDKVNITSYQTFAVKTVNTTDKTVVDQYRTSTQNNLITIDEDDIQKKVIIKKVDGSATTLNNIKQWDILSIKESNAEAGKDIMEVIVSSNYVTGNITSLNKDNLDISINGKDYKISKYFSTYNPTGLKTLAVDDSGKFYLDKDGKVAAIDKTESAGGNYGYLKKAVVERDVAKFAIFTTSGSMQIYSGASRIKIDGESSSSASSIVEKLNESAKISSINLDTPVDERNGNAQLIKYTLNSSGQVSVIDTVAEAAIPKESDLTVFEFPAGHTNKMKYYNRVFKNNSNDEFWVDSNTKIFLVPSDRNSDDDYSYKIATNYFSINGDYYVEPYDITNGIAKVLVVYDSDYEAIVTNHTPIVIVKNVVNTTNSNGNSSYLITGQSIGANASEIQIYTESTSDSFNIGDVIRYGLTPQGYIKDGTVQKVLDVTGVMTAFNNKSTETYNNLPIYHVMDGLLVSAEGQMFKLANANNFAGIEQASTESFVIGSSTLFFTYKASINNKLESISNNLYLTTIPSYDGIKGTTSTNVSEVFVYSYEGSVKAVYIIER